MELWIKVDVEDINEPIYLPPEIFTRACSVQNIFVMLCVIHNNVPQYTDVLSLLECKIDVDDYNTILQGQDMISSHISKDVCKDFFNSSAYYMFKSNSKRVLPVVYH